MTLLDPAYRRLIEIFRDLGYPAARVNLALWDSALWAERHWR
jgi:hypothetical protein